MVSLKHKFQSAKADGIDSTLVKPSDWNDEHDLILPDAGVLGKLDAGSGPAVLIPFSGLGLIPAGTLLPYAGATEPSGFLFPYGQVLNRADQPALFAAIGTAYNTGGETSAQFRLPDMRDVVPAGRGNMGGAARNLLDNSTALGGLMGSKNHVLTVAELAAHDHPVSDPGHAHTAPYGGPTDPTTPSTGGGSVHSPYGAQTVSASGTGIGVGSRGGNQAHNNVQPTTIVNWLIKT